MHERLPFFFARIRQADNGCIEWTGWTNGDGYGQMYEEGHHGRITRIHRWSYEQFVGPIPDGMQIDHLCRNRPCVRPSHLEPVTSRENTLRGEGIAARRAAQTHCKRGHEFTPENTRVDGTSRVCRACARLRWHERKARVRANP